MAGEISRTSIAGEDNAYMVQRVKNGSYQLLKETVSTTGEIVDPSNELVTTEIITITRQIGINQGF